MICTYDYTLFCHSTGWRVSKNFCFRPPFGPVLPTSLSNAFLLAHVVFMSLYFCITCRKSLKLVPTLQSMVPLG